MPPQSNKPIPLMCNLCEKTPNFSDLSHLLTHISSKSHLANKFKLQILATSDVDANAKLEAFDGWFDEYEIAELLSDRLTSKDQKVPTKRIRKSAGNKGPSAKRIKREPASASGAENPDGLPKMHTWRTGLRKKAMLNDRNTLTRSPEPSGSFNGPDSNDKPVYDTPTPNRYLPNFATLPSPAAGGMGMNILVGNFHTLSPVKLEDSARLPNSESQKLKGHIWPGMHLFDAATPEQQRKRNQRKDPSVLAQLKVNSAESEPTELIFNVNGDLERIRDIYDDSTDIGSSPVKREPEIFPSPRRRRVTRSSTKKAGGPLVNLNTNAPRLRQDKLKGSASKSIAKLEVVSVAPRRSPRKKSQLPNPLQINNMSYAPSAEENEEFRLTVGDLGHKRKLAVFRDGNVPSPGRTESPLEEHKFEFDARLTGSQDGPISSLAVTALGPLQFSPFRDALIAASTQQSLLEDATKTAESPFPRSPFLLQQELPIENGLPPSAFQHSLPNPLLWNNHEHAFPLAEYNPYQGEFKPFIPDPFFDLRFQNTGFLPYLNNGFAINDEPGNNAGVTQSPSFGFGNGFHQSVCSQTLEIGPNIGFGPSAEFGQHTGFNQYGVLSQSIGLGENTAFNQNTSFIADFKPLMASRPTASFAIINGVGAAQTLPNITDNETEDNISPTS